MQHYQGVAGNVRCNGVKVLDCFFRPNYGFSHVLSRRSFALLLCVRPAVQLPKPAP